MSFGIRAWLFAFALALASPAAAGQDDVRLDTLFGRLKETPNTLEAYAIEQDIWGIWLESGDVDVDTEMKLGIRAMGGGDYAGALLAFDSVVERRPELAEGWNKRATFYYLMGEYDSSVRDIQRTLALESRHFGALSGLGLIYGAIGNENGAVAALEEVRKIYPLMPGLDERIGELRDAVKGKRI
ncbi:MAG TPA: tetratricopeptide repeat protein [Rhodospirillales bacterium]|jgi:tetratricopeptide (TPR) repeat protein|nr:tetratricopeptide repeat protein [Rhodospirillales bacterium]HJO70013.1 tetratricopeptide repeat protein [Rhodospirillales bacterium]